MKNPNGFGTVVKLKGNRRNPYIVKKTKGWDSRGYPIFDVIWILPDARSGHDCPGAVQS